MGVAATMHSDVKDFNFCRGLCLAWSAWRGRTSMSAASAVAKWMLSGRCACSPSPLTSASPSNALSSTSRYEPVESPLPPFPQQGGRRLSSADSQVLHLLQFEDARAVKAVKKHDARKTTHFTQCAGIIPPAAFMFPCYLAPASDGRLVKQPVAV